MERDQIKQKYVLITSMNFPSGGAGATYLNLFCRGLKLNGYSIEVKLMKGHAFGKYSYKGPRKNITKEGIPYSYMGFRQRSNRNILKIVEELVSVFHLTIYLFSLLSARKYTSILVYNSEVQYNIPIILFVKIFRLKLIKFVAEIIDKTEFSSSFFGFLKRYIFEFNFKYLNKMADKLILFSFYLKNEFVNMGYNEKNIIIQPNLTDFEFWEQADSDIKYTLGYSGAPYLKDGLNDLFKAISMLNIKKIHVNLLVIGDVVFGKSLLPSLHAECMRLGLKDNVTFTGLVESSMVKNYLSECKILTITRPSTVQTKAGFPTKLGEYFATKKPVLATDFGDMKEYFTDGEDIIMAQCNNPESIAIKINWMLENNKELEEIAQRGYLRAKQLLEYKNSVKRMIDFLEYI